MTGTPVSEGSISLATTTIFVGGRRVAGGSGGADKALKSAAAFWFLVAVVGQWMFVVYILSFYGRAVLEGDLARWSKVVSPGYVRGDAVGNFALAMHLVVAV